MTALPNWDSRITQEPGSPDPQSKKSLMVAVLTLVVPMLVLMFAVAVPMAGIRLIERKLG